MPISRWTSLSVILALFSATPIAKGQKLSSSSTIAYEIRRGTSDDFSASSLVGITTKSHFSDKSANTHGENYTYFVRAVPGQISPVTLFAGNIPAQLFHPATSSPGVPDLVYYTLDTSFNASFYLLDSVDGGEATLIWPEDSSFANEQLSPPQTDFTLLVRLVLQNRIYTFDEDGTVELIAYDPFAESVIASLGEVGQSPAANWSPAFEVSNDSSALTLDWTSYLDETLNSQIVSVNAQREIPLPLAPASLHAEEKIPGKIEVSWTTGHAAETYTLYRSSDTDFSNATAIAASTENQFYFDGGLTPNSNYTYWVTSSNARAESSPSEPVELVTLPQHYRVSDVSAFGNVVRTPDERHIEHGTTLSAQAQARPGYQFSKWSYGEVESDSNPLELTVDGKLTLHAHYSLAMPEAYLSWLNSYGIDATALRFSGPDQDPDGDLRNNAIEYALGTDPLTAEASEPSSLSEQGITLELVANPSTYRMPLTLQTSTDADGWQSATLSLAEETWAIEGNSALQIESVTPVPDSELVKIVITNQLQIQNSNLLRLAVEFE